MGPLRSLLTVLLVFTLCSALAQGQGHRVLPQPVDPLTFVVMGDPQPEEPPTEEPEVFLRALRDIGSLRPDAAMLLGDLIRGFTDDTAMIAREWEGFDRAIAGTTIPFLMAVGNHDVWNEASQSAYAKRFGSLYGSATMGTVHWILLNSYELGKYNRITDAQLAWLKEDLERHRDARHIFVGVHAPLWAYGTASNWMTDVHPLLARYNVRAVFAGHWHTYQRSAITDGIRYYVTGGAGGLQAESSDAIGDFHHYMVVTVKGEDVSYAVVRPGCVSADSVVTKESSALAIRIRDEVLGDPRLEFRDSTLVSRVIRVPVRNVFDKPLQVAAEWRFSRPVFLLDAYERTSTVPPGGRAALEFRLTSEWPVGIAELLRHPPSLGLTVEVQDSLPPIRIEKGIVAVRTAVATPAPAGVEIDGELNEWPSAWPVRLDRREQVTLLPRRWGGPEEASGEFALAAGKGELLFAGSVRDPRVFHASRKDEPYQADAVTLYMDLRDSSEFQKRMFMSDVYCLVFAPPSDRNEGAYWISVYPFDRKLNGIRFQSKRVPGGYTVEAAIPYSELKGLPAPGETIGLDICIDNLDQRGNRTRMAWNGIWANFMYANRYGRLRFP